MEKEGNIRIPSGCAVAAVISKTGKRMSGKTVVEAMTAEAEMTEQGLVECAFDGVGRETL